MKMKFVKGIALTMALAAFAVVSATAQPKNAGEPQKEKTPKTAEQIAEKMSEGMVKKLKLDEKQAKNLYEVNLKFIKEKQAAVEAAKQMEVDKVKAIVGVLNADQVAQYVLSLEKRAKNAKKGGQQGVRGQQGKGAPQGGPRGKQADVKKGGAKQGGEQGAPQQRGPRRRPAPEQEAPAAETK